VFARSLPQGNNGYNGDTSSVMRRESRTPPSTDDLTRKTRSQRIKSGRKAGGQWGHPGYTLSLVEQPDEVLRHRPDCCAACQHPLAGVAGEVIERRQVQDLPPWRSVVSEQQVEPVQCPACQEMNHGTFPAEVSSPSPVRRARAGAGRVFASSVSSSRLERTCEALAEWCGYERSAGTLARLRVTSRHHVAAHRDATCPWPPRQSLTTRG
jgi:transposase